MVDKQTVQKVASLARVKISEKETARFVKDFKAILDFFSEIDKIDASKAEPAFQPVDIKNVLREDKAGISLEQEQALRNTKHKKSPYFKGPRVVDENC